MNCKLCSDLQRTKCPCQGGFDYEGNLCQSCHGSTWLICNHCSAYFTNSHQELFHRFQQIPLPNLLADFEKKREEFFEKIHYFLNDHQNIFDAQAIRAYVKTIPVLDFLLAWKRNDFSKCRNLLVNEEPLPVEEQFRIWTRRICEKPLEHFHEDFEAINLLRYLGEWVCEAQYHALYNAREGQQKARLTFALIHLEFLNRKTKAIQQKQILFEDWVRNFYTHPIFPELTN